jgi:recombination protein RecR
MLEYPKNLKTVMQDFSKLPGVGHRTATRFALSVLGWGKEEMLEFARNIEQLTVVNECHECGAFCEMDQAECSLCMSDVRNEDHSICVVENFNDLMAIERSGKFEGIYHITKGVLNPLLGIGPHHLRINSLLHRVKEKKILRVILAINPSVEGDATCSYIKELLGDLCLVERIGFGVPIGGSLEFLDSQTISTALDNRRSMHN